MKNVLIIALLLTTSVVFSQRRGNDRSGMPNTNQRANAGERAKFEAKKIARLVEYNPKKILKKLKLKSKDSIAKSMVKHLDIYNAEIKKLETANKDLFEGLDVVVNQNVETARNTQNRALMQETMQMVGKTLKPINEKVDALEATLNEAFAATLSQELNAVWLEYQEKFKSSLRPPMGNRANRGNSSRPNGQRRRGR